MGTYRSVPYRVRRIGAEDLAAEAARISLQMDERRSVRHFSPEPVPREVIEQAIRAASTAPSGANRQPWTFVLVGDPDVKRHIRIAAEAEERENYEGGRLPAEWRRALDPLGTDWRKPFLEIAPWLVIVFEQRFAEDPNGVRRKHYYVKESVGIACGIFITTLHRLGLATLPHTPSPMAFLSEVLGRPENERPFILFPVGYPAADCEVPDLRRKDLDEVLVEVTAGDLPEWTPSPAEMEGLR